MAARHFFVQSDKETKQRKRFQNEGSEVDLACSFQVFGTPKARCSPEPPMCEPLLLANSYTHTLRPVRSRASTLAKKPARPHASLLLHSWWVNCLICAVIFLGMASPLSRPRFEVGWRRGSASVQIRWVVHADSAGCSLGRFSHWWRSVWVSVFGERGVHTSVALASTVLLGCQKRGNCTLCQLTSPRSESVFFASFLCRFGQRNDVPPRTVANSDKEKIRITQTTNTESSNPALTQTANAGTWQPGTDPRPLAPEPSNP